MLAPNTGDINIHSSAFHLLPPWLENDFMLSSKTSYYFFIFWTLIAERVIDSISVLARTCPRLAGEDWSHRREYCWRHNHAVAHTYEVGTKKYRGILTGDVAMRSRDL